ncbi:MAG: TolC family protein [Bacteroidia bacterium]
MKRKLFFCGCFVVFACIRILAQTTLAAYIDTALKNNPSLQVYTYESSALQQEIKSAKALNDPQLNAGIMNLPSNFNFTDDMMTMEQVGIEQSFSVGKKYFLRNDVAEKNYEVSTYNVKAQQLLLIKEVKQIYYDLYTQNKMIEITKKNIEILKSYIDIANTKYSTGQGTQQDVMKAQVEVSKMQEQVIDAQSMKEYLTATFNTLLSRDIMDSVELPEEISFQKINLLMYPLMQEVAVNNPMVLSSKITQSKDSAFYLLANTSKTPDFTAGFWYGERQATMIDGSKASNLLGFTFGMNLPLYYKKKQNPLIAEASIKMQESQSVAEATQHQYQLDLHHVLIDAYRNEKIISLYQTQLIPETTENVAAGITGYQENKIDFMTLIDNFLSLYNYQLKYYQAIADYYKAVAGIEMVTGKKLITQ